MTGAFIAHETIGECESCKREFGSLELKRIVANRCNVAFDVMVFVGKALYQRHCTTENVRTELLSRNVPLCSSEIDYLGRKFIAYLAYAHRQAAPRIRDAIRLAGGYILHLDATHEADAPALMSGLDSISKIVLANVKVPSEHHDHIAPFLRKIQEAYGTPLACVHDMGNGICKAVEDVFPGVHDFVCHFHFLRDLGKDYLEPAYREIRDRLRAYAASTKLRALVKESKQRICNQTFDSIPLAKGIINGDLKQDPSLLPEVGAYCLTLWALQGKHDADGYGFPFDLPLLVFAERLLELSHHLPRLIQQVPRDPRGNNRPLFKLAREVCNIAKDSELNQAVEELRWRTQIFEKLRKAMRIALPGGTNGLNDDGTSTAISSIRKGVEKFRNEIATDTGLADDPLTGKMIEQIDRYDKKLFADPIVVDTPEGKITVYPQRTNNILEQFFRALRRGHRKKTGDNSMSRTLHTMLADTPLIKNLENPHYMKILLDGRSSLEDLFADFGDITFPKLIESEANTDRILPGFRAVVKMAKLPDKVIRIFEGNLQMAKSN